MGVRVCIGRVYFWRLRISQGMGMRRIEYVKRVRAGEARGAWKPIQSEQRLWLLLCILEPVRGKTTRDEGGEGVGTCAMACDATACAFGTNRERERE